MKRILLFTVLAALVLTLAACGKDPDKSLELEVEEITQTRDGQQVLLSYENETGGKVSFGWVNSCEILVTVDGKTQSFAPPSGDIARGDGKVTLNLPDCEGEIQKIVITKLCQLDDRGLPDQEMKDVTVYDRSRNIDSFEDSFNTMDFQDIMFIVVPVIIVVIFALIVISIIVTVRRNKRAMAKFNPYGAPDFQQDMAHQQHMQMHQQAHQMHMNAHQQAVQQHNDFAMQSVTPMDQGGFAPPPPPPPPPGF